MSLLETIQTRNEEPGIHIADGVGVSPSADSVLMALSMLKLCIPARGPRSNAEREFMNMKETHDRIREEFLAAPPEYDCLLGRRRDKTEDC